MEKRNLVMDRACFALVLAALLCSSSRLRQHAAKTGTDNDMGLPGSSWPSAAMKPLLRRTYIRELKSRFEFRFGVGFRPKWPGTITNGPGLKNTP